MDDMEQLTETGQPADRIVTVRIIRVRDNKDDNHTDEWSWEKETLFCSLQIVIIILATLLVLYFMYLCNQPIAE
jgi:hypothetical protein